MELYYCWRKRIWPQLCESLQHIVDFILSQMKAVAGMKMSYSLQQAIVLSRRTIVRGFRQDETHSALCSHLFTMIRGNRQHRRAFLISLLNLFDDSAVSKPAFILTSIVYGTCQDADSASEIFNHSHETTL